jgi:hypothetical protein
VCSTAGAGAGAMVGAGIAAIPGVAFDGDLGVGVVITTPDIGVGRVGASVGLRASVGAAAATVGFDGSVCVGDGAGAALDVGAGIEVGVALDVGTSVGLGVTPGDRNGIKVDLALGVTVGVEVGRSST